MSEESKIRPGRITDEQIRAYRVAYYAQMHAGTAGPDQGNAIRAGLAAAYVRRELERRTEPELHPINLDPYPASVGEVADEIVRYVLELEDSVARGLLHGVIGRLTATAARRNRAEPGPEDPEVRAEAIRDWEESNRPY